MRRNSAKILADGRAVNWLGANFWSRTGGPLMWRNYDGQTVGGELRVRREHGLTVTRSFSYWPDFMPEPDRVDEKLTARFADFLDRHAEMGMQTIPTFEVGPHVRQNWDPFWRQGRDLYSDVWMVARQAWLPRKWYAGLACTRPAVTGGVAPPGGAVGGCRTLGLKLEDRQLWDRRRRLGSVGFLWGFPMAWQRAAVVIGRVGRSRPG